MISVPGYIHAALEAVGALFVAVVAWRGLVHLYYRRVVAPRSPREYGKWAIVTGSTSGIGKDFVEHLAGLGMSILLISRSEDKLVAQKDELKALVGKREGFGVVHLAYDFTDMGPARAAFYQALEEICGMMHRDGGIGLLVNNVGTVHYHPQTLAESSAADIDAMLNCNMNSVVYMSKTVARFMEERKSGCVISISSASGTSPNPYISIYSATKSFVTQFSRSMHVEMWGSGVEFYAATPMYVVSNLYKRKQGSLFAPMPIELVKGILSQIGKGPYHWEGHGYWFHGFMAFLQQFNPYAAARRLQMVKASRARHEARKQQSK